jgi:small neutral amino acid transporter SnatA (MarC family)
MNEFFLQLIFLVIIINPVSQMMLILSIAREHPDRDVSRLIYLGNLWAFLITALIAGTGSFLFKVVFRVDVATLRLAGGLVLAGIGYARLSRGVTFHLRRDQDLGELKVVPFAVPLIVGPATFAQAVTIAAHSGELFALGAVAAAIVLNVGLMRLTLLLQRVINQNVVNVSIRLSGLITLTIGLQMVYDAVVELVRMAG